MASVNLKVCARLAEGLRAGARSLTLGRQASGRNPGRASVLRTGWCGGAALAAAALLITCGAGSAQAADVKVVVAEQFDVSVSKAVRKQLGKRLGSTPLEWEISSRIAGDLPGLQVEASVVRAGTGYQPPSDDDFSFAETGDGKKHIIDRISVGYPQVGAGNALLLVTVAERGPFVIASGFLYDAEKEAFQRVYRSVVRTEWVAGCEITMWSVGIAEGTAKAITRKPVVEDAKARDCGKAPRQAAQRQVAKAPKPQQKQPKKVAKGMLDGVPEQHGIVMNVSPNSRPAATEPWTEPVVRPPARANTKTAAAPPPRPSPPRGSQHPAATQLPASNNAPGNRVQSGATATTAGGMLGSGSATGARQQPRNAQGCVTVTRGSLIDCRYPSDGRTASNQPPPAAAPRPAVRPSPLDETGADGRLGGINRVNVAELLRYRMLLVSPGRRAALEQALDNLIGQNDCLKRMSEGPVGAGGAPNQIRSQLFKKLEDPDVALRAQLTNTREGRKRDRRLVLSATPDFSPTNTWDPLFCLESPDWTWPKEYSIHVQCLVGLETDCRVERKDRRLDLYQALYFGKRDARADKGWNQLPSVLEGHALATLLGLDPSLKDINFRFWARTKSGSLMQFSVRKSGGRAEEVDFELTDRGVAAIVYAR